MHPVGKSKSYCRSYEFHQIVCPFNKHSQNKQNFGKIFKIQAFEVDLNNNSISCNCFVKINKIPWNKMEYFISIATFFDRHLVFGCKSIEH